MTEPPLHPAENCADDGASEAADSPATVVADAAVADAEVAAALSELARLPQLPVEQHVAVFDGVHRRLRDRLGDAGEHVDEVSERT